MEYILSDESINSYGFRVLTAGIDTESRYAKNPVILYQHDDRIMSVGKMKLTKKENQLIGEPEFDLEDPIGKELARKYEKGYMNGFSIGIDPKKLSDSPNDLLPGQTRMTIAESELYEISVANLPSNKNAVRLTSDNINDIPNLKQLNMKKIALKFGLKEDATESEILEKLEVQQAETEKLKTENAGLHSKILNLEKEKQAAKDKELEMALANPKKAFTAEQKEQFRKLAKQDFDETMKLINLQPDQQSLNGFVKDGNKKDENQEKTFAQLQKENPKYLEKLKTENWDAFKELYVKQFGREPKKS